MGMNDDKGIMVGDKYKVEIDRLNTTLYELMVRKNKTHYWYPIAYFSPELPENTLHYIIDMEVADTGYETYEDVVKRQKELHEFIDTVIREVAPQLVRAI